MFINPSYPGWCWKYPVRSGRMITPAANRRSHILQFWEKHGLQATLDAFKAKRRTLFLWKKKLKEAGFQEILNDRSRAPHTRRKRRWPLPVLEEIQRLRNCYPNLGKEKLYMPVRKFCHQNNVSCPKPSTIGRLIHDLGGLRFSPRKYTGSTYKPQKNRQKVLRKPKDLIALYPGHVVALDTVERVVMGRRRYIITFEDLYSRFAFAWATTSHASQAAEEFFGYCRSVFPVPFTFVLTDNGSEFKKHFSKALEKLHIVHYHTYPKTPKMNAHCERFNRTIQEEFVDYNAYYLQFPDLFNRKLMEWLIWYNGERPHFAFKNRLSPLQFLISLTKPQECNLGWTHTLACFFGKP